MKKIGIIGGGPAALFLYKRFVESDRQDLLITIFEKNDRIGPGMPYSPEGARVEHVTNVSDNEIPDIMEHVKDWVDHVPQKILGPFHMRPEQFNSYKVLPRLLFGEYLAHQFDQLHDAAKRNSIKTNVVTHAEVTNVVFDKEKNMVNVSTANGETSSFDDVILCTGHTWPTTFEGKVEGWFDSPYPPSKIANPSNFPIAIKGASLTAIDAVRTLARQNGKFITKEDGMVTYLLHESSPQFSIVLHSINGLLPAIRFHLEDTYLSRGLVLSPEEVYEIKELNGGFIPLDFIFDRNFKKPIEEVHPEFYETIREMTMEDFVTHMMSLRNRLDAFQLFKAEYAEAEKSIKRKQSVYWKEMLASLSYAMNYPAKHLSAEDMLRVKKTLMPLVSIIIAFVPQSSCRELIALYDAGVLRVESVDESSKVEPAEEGGAWYYFKDESGVEKKVYYRMFINATGQPAVSFKDFPFPGLKEDGTVSEAFLRFRDPKAGAQALESGNNLVQQVSDVDFYLQVPGININDHFQVLDKYGVFNNKIYVMAVPLIAGLNPDYSGLDFCETASARIADVLLADPD